MIIIRPPVAGMDMRDLLAALDAMRTADDPPIETGSGGFVVGDWLAYRFLAALLGGVADPPHPPPQTDVTVWDVAPPPAGASERPEKRTPKRRSPR
jgi:hypothetical protein